MAARNTNLSNVAAAKQPTTFKRQSIFTMSFNPFTQSQQRPVATPKNGTCTHLTMTRLYTADFRCVVCYQVSSLGWLYRCTQDRELILEEELEKSSMRFDAMVHLFPQLDKPKKRSARARARIDSFIEENSKEQLGSYTNDQLMTIYAQRVHVLQTAAEDSATENKDHEKIYQSFTPSSSSSKQAATPWLPVPGTECQFKCCHHCRPSLTERAYMSLNGVANGDIPLAAVTGFGFHLQPEKRPVALVEVVKNLGLRPSPVSRIESTGLEIKHKDGLFPLQPPSLTGFGLGLIDINVSKPLPPRPLPELPTSSLSENIQVYDFAYGPREQSAHLPTDTSAYRTVTTEPTPLPPQTAEEPEKVSVPLTPMEKSEMEGYFGREPLEVSDGIAVTEEAVGLHVPDLITQF